MAAVLGSVALLSGVFGCNDEAVVDDKPAGAVTGMAGNAGFAGMMMAGVGGATAGAGGATGGVGGATGGIGGAAGTVSGMGGAAGTIGGMGGATGGIGGATGGIGGAAGAMGGEGGAIGGMGGAGGATGGMGGVSAPGPCPGDWICEDTSSLGATDKDGNPITGASCGGKGLVECNDADPAASCPDLPNAFCAHVFGITSCTQLCTP